jgi:LemA protein
MRRVLALLAVVMLVAPATGCGYNRIQTLEESVDGAKGQIEVQLQRRADLVPNLVSTVRGYAAHEEGVFTQVAQARAGLMNAVASGSPEQMANADASMNSALGRLLAVVEAYPQLKADQSFTRLMDELAGTENRVAVSRGDYNTAVQQYNAYIRQFPAVMTAKATGARQREYYRATSAEATAAPSVDFSRPDAAPPAGAAPPTQAAPPPRP